MAHLLPNVKQRFFDSNGEPLAGGKLYSYAAGTSTPLATYTDQTEGTENANPVILDANGEASIWIGSSVYKFILDDADDVEQWSVDNVAHISDLSITTAKIAASAVTTAKIADGAITQAKLAAKSITTEEITIPSTSSTTAVGATGSLAFTSTGRPVKLQLIGEDDAGTPALIKVSAPPLISAKGTVEIWRNAVMLSAQSFGVERNLSGNALLDEFTSSDTYTVVGNGTLLIEGAGGGGGGGGGAAGSGGTGGVGGGGGGASYHPPMLLSVTDGEVLTITIGAAGTGGSGNGGTGVAGGDTVVTSDLQGEVLRIAGGGAGGSASDDTTAGSAGSLGGAGGAGATNNHGTAGSRAGWKSNYAGGAGGTGSTGNLGRGGGGGGATGFGAGGKGGNRMVAGTDAAATAYGAGGGGGGGGDDGNSGLSAGDGAGGIIRIYDGAAGSGGSIDAFVPPSAFSAIDEAPVDGLNNYTVKVYVSNANATLSATGTISLQAYEL